MKAIEACQAGEALELADQVRLVAVAAVQRHLGPAGSAPRGEPFDDGVEAAHPAVLLGRQADLALEQCDEPLRRPADGRAHRLDLRQRRVRIELAQRPLQLGAHRERAAAALQKPQQEGFERLQAPGCAGETLQLLAQRRGTRAPQGVERHHPPGELAERHAEQRRRAAGSELHPDHRRRRRGVAQEMLLARPLHQPAAQLQALPVGGVGIACQVVLLQRDDQVGAAGRQVALARVGERAAFARPQALDMGGQRRGDSTANQHCAMMDAFARGVHTRPPSP